MGAERAFGTFHRRGLYAPCFLLLGFRCGFARCRASFPHTACLSKSATAARCKNSLSPNPTKKQKSTRPEQSESNLRTAQAGALGGKFSEREGGLEGENPVFQDGVLSLQGLPFPHFVSSSSTSSANISATVGLCSTGFGVTSPALMSAHFVREGPSNS